ncbi:MAG: hypothetical protein KF819_33770 [Labilithrix sp.]|nr:hypothetical protein [Labilithrix sp.]
MKNAIGLALLALVLASCTEKKKADDCRALRAVLRVGRTTSCPLESTEAGRAKRSEATATLEAQSAALDRLALETDEIKRARDEFRAWAASEASQCKSYDGSPTDEARSASRASLHKIASDRFGYYEGFTFNCDQVEHPPHFP